MALDISQLCGIGKVDQGMQHCSENRNPIDYQTEFDPSLSHGNHVSFARELCSKKSCWIGERVVGWISPSYVVAGKSCLSWWGIGDACFMFDANLHWLSDVVEAFVDYGMVDR